MQENAAIPLAGRTRAPARAATGLSVRRVILRVHWLLGISAGLVLAFMGVTGAMMAFEDEIMEALSPQARVEIGTPMPLSPDVLLARVGEQLPQAKILSLQVENEPDRAYTVTIRRQPADGGRNPRIYLNPYDGTLRGEATGAEFFGRVRSLHRYLTASGATNDIGRHVTGICAIAVVFFALSGLYLRWPNRPLAWRSWVRIDLSLRGRALYRSLHSVIGSWLALIYVVSALSGLWWSWDWYRGAVTWLLTAKIETAEGSKAATPKSATAKPAAQPLQPDSLSRVLAAVKNRYAGRLESVVILIPAAGKPVRVRVLPTNAGHGRALDDLQIDAQSGRIVREQLYENLALGDWIKGNMDPIHTGIAFGPAGRAAVFLAALGLPMFAATGLLLYVDRRRKRSTVADVPPSVSRLQDNAKPGPLIVYASQTGGAEALARQSVGRFQQNGIAARLLPIAELDADRLQREGWILLVASTYGDGHAPDSARLFQSRVMGSNLSLMHLRYGLLALGDLRHNDFCAFGRRLDNWLTACGARSDFARVDIDSHANPDALPWWDNLRKQGAADFGTGEPRKRFTSWRLDSRERLNDGSIGAAVFRVRLVPHGHAASWEPGDIAEILAGPSEDGEKSSSPMREYSIASIAADGAITLIVRQVSGTDGKLGLGSGWLTAHASIGSDISLRIRRNAAFHPPEIGRPMILIGNGTGIAGLHAHLRYRAGDAAGENWLFFGERNRACDFLLEDELQALRSSGALQRLSMAFSRDQRDRIYVQDRIREEAEEFCHWVARGAAIYVCGSSDTMAPAVDATLRDILSAGYVDELIASGRYRRDIY